MFNRVLKILSSPHFWVVVVMFVAGIIFHYPQQVLSSDSPTLFTFIGLTRHTVERILSLLPVIYAGLVFGIRAGLVCLGITIAILLPRVFLISPSFPDALLETGGIVIIGGLVNIWFEKYRKERERRQQTLTELEGAHQQLQSQVQVIENREKRLEALNAISAAISQSLETKAVLDVAVDKVVEILDLEAASAFLLNEETHELELETYRGVSKEEAKDIVWLNLGKEEKLGAALTVPLKAKDERVGALTVATRSSRQFVEEEVDLLTTIGRQIGMAIDNARLYQKQRMMAEQIARDAIMEKQMQENLRFYLQQVTRAQEEERNRIARELHDDTAQELVVLTRKLDRIISSTPEIPMQKRSCLEEIRLHADEILDGIRRFSQDLRPSILDDLGLVPALEWLTADVTNNFGITVGFGLLGSPHRFPPETELVLFRIAQEALRNVCKHSKASRAWVSLEFTDNKVALTVKDNGKGFMPPSRIGDLASTGKLGLTGMQERTQLINGEIKLESEPGKGTTVTVEVPSKRA